MPSTVTLVWKERQYEIPRLMARDAVAFFEVQDTAQEMIASGVRAKQIAATAMMIEALKCPAEILEAMTIDEIDQYEPLLTALMGLQFPKQMGGERAPPPAGGPEKEEAAPIVPADSLPGSPDSMATASPQFSEPTGST